jgi:cobalt/nickel-transporting P-type ATPase D
VQIVKSYYGGRDVTPEDLEIALLVGMSPHERRRLEKKKGYSFKTQAQIIIRKSSNVTTLENSGHESDNNHALPEQVPENETESNSLQEFDEAGSQDKHEGSTQHQGNSSLPMCKDDSALDNNTVKLGIDTDVQESAGACTSANGHLDRDPSLCDSTNQAMSKNAEKKISLLGHGHHGKQVVEFLLSNRGEEAINQFCQRWRQVFVEAVHPRYLPSGWNINHRLSCLSYAVYFFLFARTPVSVNFFSCMHIDLHLLVNFLVRTICQACLGLKSSVVFIIISQAVCKMLALCSCASGQCP